MSKVNRRKEIKEKEALQLKFQLALSENSKNVQSWLPQAKNSTVTDSLPNDSQISERQLFLDLPIVANGAGLSELEKSTTFNTVGDFLQSEGAPKNVKPENTTDIRNGSRAMAALMNRMRTDTRKNLRNQGPERVHKNQAHGLKLLLEVRKLQKQSQPAAKSAANEPDDSDEEQTKLKQINAKKNGGLAFGKKKRPF